VLSCLRCRSCHAVNGPAPRGDDGLNQDLGVLLLKNDGQEMDGGISELMYREKTRKEARLEERRLD
jgi:hypothetical protein